MNIYSFISSPVQVVGFRKIYKGFQFFGKFDFSTILGPSSKVSELGVFMLDSIFPSSSEFLVASKSKNTFLKYMLFNLVKLSILLILKAIDNPKLCVAMNAIK